MSYRTDDANQRLSWLAGKPWIAKTPSVVGQMIRMEMDNLVHSSNIRRHINMNMNKLLVFGASVVLLVVVVPAQGAHAYWGQGGGGMVEGGADGNGNLALNHNRIHWIQSHKALVLQSVDNPDPMDSFCNKVLEDRNIRHHNQSPMPRSLLRLELNIQILRYYIMGPPMFHLYRNYISY